MIDDLAQRVKPARLPSRGSPSWLGPRTLVLLVLGLSLAFLGTLYWMLSGSGRSLSGKFEFPAPPRLDAAVSAAQDRLKINPNDLAALTELGMLHFQQGREHYPEAINELEEARDLGALDPRIFYCLGVMYQDVGLYHFAIEEYQRFLRHYPEDREVRLLEAKLLYQQQRYDEAVTEYERLKFSNPKDSLVEENLGLSFLGAKNIDRAVDSFNRLRGMGQEQAKRAELYLGEIAYAQGDYKAALEHLLKAQPAPGDAAFALPPERAHRGLAQALQKLGQYEQAEAAWKLVVQEDPRDAKARASLRFVSRRVLAKRRSARAKPGRRRRSGRKR